MRPDPTFFHLLLGERDWGRCRIGEPGGEAVLQSLWVLDFGSREPVPPDWDSDRAVLTLPRVRDIVPPTKGEAALSLAARRAGAADANGNIYWIGDDARQLFVRSAGTGQPSRFWPDPRAFPEPEGVFGPLEPPRADSRIYAGMAITDDAWLLVGFEDGDGRSGLSLFDLVGGGAPIDRLWPASDPVQVMDLATGPHGTLWLLDDQKRLFELDRRTEIAGAANEQPAAELFQPDSGEPRSHAAPPPLRCRDLGSLDPAINPIAIEMLADGAVAILSRQLDHGLVYVLRVDGGEAPPPARVDFRPHDMSLGNAMLRDRVPGLRLIVTGGAGNQAIAFRIDRANGGVRLEPTSEVFPLRRYGGRGLLTVLGAIHYDSGDVPTWTPLAERPVVRFAASSEFVTPVFDGGIPATVWDRVRIDGSIPPGTKVQIAARAGDEGEFDPELLGEWTIQPEPILNAGGDEFAGYGPAAVPLTDRQHGKGTWELLVQQMRGRFLQLRLTLSGNENASPELRALRAWYPRQSWSERYLPAVYRAEPSPAAFLDRFLANMEGTLTTIERRIVDAQAMFDPRTAPVEALDWLASWFDVALDPSWSEAQRRLLIAHATRFLALRGTRRGVETALALAFTQCADERLFDAADTVPTGIRIVENFLTRKLAALPAQAAPGADYWSPGEGNVALAERIARAMGKDHASEDERAQPVPLFVPKSIEPTKWRKAMMAVLGFVPEAGGAERWRWQEFQAGRGRESPLPDLPRHAVPSAHRADWLAFVSLASRSRRLWQDFLEGRYARIASLNIAHGSGWTNFSEIALPDRLPNTTAASKDWRDFETRVLPFDAAAHRFTVLLPVRDVVTDSAALTRDRALARRIVDLEKPAHTIFDVRFYFAMNRLGEARLGFDTTLGQGSRAPELLPPAILGRSYFGESFVGRTWPEETGRRRLAC
ncbi:MAG TPA: phage tail protein [Sphingomicrobium sp.]|nr:phage tail protein [Sphingomicrobium sp.]